MKNITQKALRLRSRKRPRSNKTKQQPLPVATVTHFPSGNVILGAHDLDIIESYRLGV